MKGLTFTLILVVVFAAATHSTVIYVPDDQPTVQAGIDAASTGDTVQVAPNTYYENVTIDKTITLLGETKISTVINASDSGDCILVTAAGAVIKNLSVQHGGIEDSYQTFWDSGIKIVGADNVIVENCFICNNGAAGLSLTVSSYCIIRGCYISQNVSGIYFFEDPYGSYSDNASNQITGNVIMMNSSTGIRFEHTGSTYHSANIVRSNFIAGNGVGMSMIMSEYNEVTYNYFYLNFGVGLGLSMCMGGGQNNTIHHNSFKNNNSYGVQGSDYGGGTDYWYSVSEQEGNYWSDYGGVDNNSDGIGDTPYAIEGGETSDLYPLMSPEDSDGDGAIDSVDNCPGLYNPSQADNDGDLIGNHCDNCTDIDGDGYGNPGYAANICPDDNCPSIYNPNQEDFDGDGVGDSCDFHAPEIDEIWTECLGLMVDNDGNFGVKGNDGNGGCNLDYTYYGNECDQWADTYLYDGTPFVLRINGDDTLLSQAIYNTHSYLRVEWGNPYEGISTGLDYDLYKSGTFVTYDYSIGLEQWFWAPKAADTCNFIIKALRVYSFDGEQHDNVSIGTGIDWDIPSDAGADNEGGFDSTKRLIYQQGLEIDELGCQSNAARFGGEALLSIYLNDTCMDSDAPQPYSAWVGSNAEIVWPARGFVPSQLDSMIHIPGYAIETDTVDLHTVMTYLVDQTLMPGDTLTIYSVLTTVRDGSLPTLLNNVAMAQSWFADHIASDCLCCEGMRGNVNDDPTGMIDISDLVYLVDYMFTGGPMPPCLDEANVNGIEVIDISDLVYMVDYMFSGGPPPVVCP